MKYAPIISLMSTILLSGISMAQPGIDWIRCYGEAGWESFGDIYATPDGNYLMVGTQTPANGHDSLSRAYALLIDSEGEVVWEQNYDGQNVRDALTCAIETDDGDFIMGGRRGLEANLYRISPEGDVRWFRTYGSGQINAVIELKEGDLAAAGNGLVVDGQQFAIIMRIQGDGEVVWQNDVQLLSYQNIFNGLRETDAGIIAAGLSNRRPPFVQYHMMAQKVDFNGEVIWTQIYDQEENTSEFGTAICSLPGGFLIPGFAYRRNAMLLTMRKINGDGEPVWSVSDELGFGLDLSWSACTRLGNNDAALVGSVSVGGMDIRPAARVVSPDGEIRWTSVYDMNELGQFVAGSNTFTSVVESADGGLIAAGRVNNSPNESYYDGFIMKLEPLRLAPMIIMHLPLDTLQTVLQGDSLEFMVLGNDQRGLDLSYLWLFNSNDTLSRDTSVIQQFDEMGLDTVSCTVSNDEFSTSIRWHVTVTDFFVVSHTPDTLDLTLRRGSSVDFSIDSVAAIEDEQPVSFQWTLFPANEQAEVIGADSSVTIDFLRSGNYTVEGMAYRGESHDEVVWDVEVRGAIWSFLPEELSVERLEGDNVEFQIIPTVSDTINRFSWLYDGEIAEGEGDSVFVMNFFEVGEHMITGILADSIESDSVSWTVLVESNSVSPSLSLEPSALSLSASPNPFNSMLTIRFQSSPINREAIRLGVYDLSGREVARLYDSQTLTPSHSHTLTWNASSLPAGVYLVRLQQRDLISTRKVVLLK